MRIGDTVIVRGPRSKLGIAPMANDLEFNSTSPETMIKFSDAVTLLSTGMWGGLSRPTPVIAAKKIYKKTSIGFGPWRESAGQCLTTATLNGELEVYAVFSGTKTRAKAVPVKVLKRLITTRGSIPDHAIRVCLKTVDGDAKLLNSLVQGVLSIRKSDFENWYLLEQRKVKWPSQRGSLKTRNGRPPNQANEARDKILALLNTNGWRRQDGIPELHRLLAASGDAGVPSPDTLDRVVKQLFRETGHPNLKLIRHRRRPKLT